MHLLRGTSMVSSRATLSVLLRAASAPWVQLLVPLAHVSLLSVLGGGTRAMREALGTAPRHRRPMLHSFLLRLATWRATRMVSWQATSAPTTLELRLQSLVLILLGGRPREAGDLRARRAVHRAAPLLEGEVRSSVAEVCLGGLRVVLGLGRRLYLLGCVKCLPAWLRNLVLLVEGGRALCSVRG